MSRDTDDDFDVDDGSDEPVGSVSRVAYYDDKPWRPEHNGHRVILGGETIPFTMWWLPEDENLSPSDRSEQVSELTGFIEESLVSLELRAATRYARPVNEDRIKSSVDDSDPQELPVLALLRSVAELGFQPFRMLQDRLELDSVRFEQTLSLSLAHGLVTIEEPGTAEARVRITSTGRLLLEENG